MGQIFLPQNIPNLVVASTTSVTIGTTNNGLSTRIDVGGQQYVPSSTLTMTSSGTGANGLDTGSLGAIQLWYVYAIVNQSTFALALIASQSAPSTGPIMPSGYGTAYRLVGAFYTNGSSQIGSMVPITGPAVTHWMSLPTPTQFGSSNGQPFSNCTVGTHQWRRNGTNLEVIGIVNFTGVPGTGTGGMTVLVSQFFLDNTVPLTNAFGPVGFANLHDGGGNAHGMETRVNTNGGGMTFNFFTASNASPFQCQPAASIPRAFANGDAIYYNASVPVVVWSGKPTLL